MSSSGRKVAVLGAGAWGTVFAQILVDAGNEVRLWARRAELAEQINRGGKSSLRARYKTAGNKRLQ